MLLPQMALAQAQGQTGAQAANTAASPEAQIESLRQRLLSAQQTIATLERQLATARDRAVLADQCRVKNGRLVFIARELIEGYEKRYHQEHKDPLQLGRRRFEFELQALSDAIYDNRADVPLRVPGENGKGENGKGENGKNGKGEAASAGQIAPAPAPAPAPGPAPAGAPVPAKAPATPSAPAKPNGQ
eukprot:gene6057-6131_t